MGLITISRGSYSKGKEIAERLALALDYECISRDILLEASEHFHVPELKLVRAIHDAPSIADRLKYGKEKYIAFIRESFLEHMLKDNIVYHGLAGHFLLKGVPRVLKVRIIANMEDRIREEMRREKISAQEARRILKKDDQERRKWSLNLHGIDTKDSSLYDIMLHIDNLKVDDAVEILADIARRDCFQTTAESRKRLEDEYRAAKLQVILIDSYPGATVSCEDGIARVRVDTAFSMKEKTEERIMEIAGKVEGLADIQIDAVPVDID